MLIKPSSVKQCFQCGAEGRFELFNAPGDRGQSVMALCSPLCVVAELNMTTWNRLEKSMLILPNDQARVKLLKDRFAESNPVLIQYRLQEAPSGRVQDRKLAPVWVTKEGVEVLITEMSQQHLLNSVSLVEKRLETRQFAGTPMERMLERWKVLFDLEMRRRGMVRAVRGATLYESLGQERRAPEPITDDPGITSWRQDDVERTLREAQIPMAGQRRIKVD